MVRREIRVVGAREHNLDDLTLRIPRDRLVVVTGISGSGKSTLAFDTLYAEGQRRYVESLSAYARQFLDQLQKPDVESIEGLPPTISIEQRSGTGTPRSTVATQTEIYDYLRVLYARAGDPYCWECGLPITQQTVQQIVDAVGTLPEDDYLLVLAPRVRGRKGQHRDVLEEIGRHGFLRARVNGQVYELADVPGLARYGKHSIDAVVDRLAPGPKDPARLAESVEAALRYGDGLVVVARVAQDGAWDDRLFSEHLACPDCGVSLEELSPRSFSFNSPHGACPKCDGLGSRMDVDADLVVPDKQISLREGAIQGWRKSGRRMALYYGRILRRFCDTFGVSMDVSFCRIPEAKRRILLHGTGDEDGCDYDFEGVIPSLERRFRETDSDYVKRRILTFMSELPCPGCHGQRLRPESLAVRIGGKNIREVCGMPVEDVMAFFQALRWDKERRLIARPILKEVRARLGFLCDVGLGYLTLDRQSSTLSGGEAQRIRLASQVGSGLVGVCYVLDEPTIGLHERDNDRLLGTLTRLRDIGNSVIVVEHDEATIRAADHVIDLGPGAGAAGGKLIAQGTPAQVERSPKSVTGAFLSGRERIEIPSERRQATPGRFIDVCGARENNLKNITVRFPVGLFVGVSGVSGSGKSTLVNEILYKGLQRALHRGRERPGDHDEIRIPEEVEKVVVIDQSPIGRTPRSNPATYTGSFDEIRNLFAMTRESRLRGYTRGRFSFNVKGGRCEACQGQGTKVIEMHFLPDVYVTCDICKGLRYNRETLEVRYRGRNIADVLALSVDEATEMFRNFPKVKRILGTVREVGLGYMRLGQPSTTLSGGEAQRIKLSAELAQPQSGRTVYILDEPTTGLHMADVQRLLDVLDRLVDRGNTVIVIEHNMHVLKTTDYLVDLGPEGGAGGGTVVACGSPEAIAATTGSYTGSYLHAFLNPAPRPRRRTTAKKKVAAVDSSIEA